MTEITEHGDRPAVAALDQLLLEQLRRGRRDGTVLTPPSELTHAQGRAYLAALIGHALDEGDEVIGWKIANLPPGGADPFALAAPVLSSTLDRYPRAPMIAPRAEIEHVAVVEEVGPTGRPTRVTWRVGIEIVDNHARDARMTPGWVTADWGLSVGTTAGDVCRAPVPGERVEVLVRLGVGEALPAEGRALDPARAFDALERDCAEIVRPCCPGDLIWTGAMIAPIPLTGKVDIVAVVSGFGSVALTGVT